MQLGAEVGLGPGHTVLDGDKVPPPQFSAHACCGQMAGWIKTPFGRKVGLGPGHTVRSQLPLPQRGTAPNFPPMSIVAKRSPISATAEHLFKNGRWWMVACKPRLRVYSGMPNLALTGEAGVYTSPES